jgi:hypothetical protein
LHQRILQGEVVATVDQELIFEMLWRVKVLARWFLSVAPTLMLWKREKQEKKRR